MTRFVRTFVKGLLLSLPLAGLQAQSPAIHARPEIRIHGKIDRTLTSTLRGTHPEVVDGAAIGSRLDSGTRLEHMILVLESSDAQKAALHTLLDAQQDKNSQSFHKWLTPDEFAAQFGVAQSDVTTVSNWLASSGMSVESVSKGGRFITFSGTVGSVESAFHTEMHHVNVRGEAHISNTSDVAVPKALANVVRGVKSLNNFFPKKTATDFRKITVQKNADGGFTSVDPLYGASSTGTHYVGAADLATIFNAKPLQQAGNNGKGVTISVLARSNIQLSDVETYRTLFGLTKNNPNVIVVGEDPGQNSDDIEAFLDAEMAGSLAQDATVNFIVSSASLVGGGIDTAGLYAVDNNIGDIISLSYGGCEKNDGASGTAFWSQLWEQAAAQGQTAFVSSGDSGAAGCDSSSNSYATAGYGVNALVSTGYAVSVGGTMFVDYNPSQFWTGSTTIPYSTALSYIPEAALNQSRLTTTFLNSTSTATQTGSGIFAGGGGISIYTARPPWQHGSGIPTGSDAIGVFSGTGIASGSTVTGLHRLQPDLSFISANGHDGTLFCAEGSCYEDANGGLASAGIVGGTSVAAPAIASAQALINAANGGRQGNANIYYYALSDRQYTASTTACQSKTGSASAPITSADLPASTCYFQDTISGSNIVPTASSGTAGIGFSAQAGYDEATGLGSPNIANLAKDWKTVTFNATSTTLSLSPTTGTHGVTQTATVQVSPASGSGTPTGDVALIATQTSGYGTPITLTLSAGNATANINGLPAGTYNVTAHYAGDTTFASSDSAPVSVTITKEGSTTNTSPYAVTSTGGLTNTSSFTYGRGEIYLDTEIVGTSGTGTASGSVTYTVVKDSQALSPLTTQLDTYGTTYLLAGPSFANFYLLANYGTLAAGSYTVTANYSGDVSFNSSSSTTTFTVAKATPAASFTTSTAEISPSSQATLNYSITTPAGSAAATGSVTFTDTTTGTVLGSGTLVNGAVVFNTNSITAPGANTISAAYAGDSNYNAAAAAPVTVTVASQSVPTVTLSTTSGTLYVGTNVVLTATLSANAASSTKVAFYDGGALLGTTTLSGGNVTSLTVNSFTAGTHSLSAKFAGNNTQQTSTGTTTITVNKNITSMRVGGADAAPLGTAVVLEGAFSRSPSTSAAPAVAPTGLIYFYDGGSTSGTLLGTGSLVFGVGGYSTYEASLSVSNLSLGSHSIVAYYPGDANYASSTSVVKPLTITQVTVTVAPVTVTYGTATTTLSATINFAGSSNAPTGPVFFSVDGGAPFAGSCSVSGTTRTCTASYATSSRTGGQHSIVVTEQADATYGAATGTGTLTVNRATPTVTVAPVSVAYGTATTTLSATINFTGSSAPTGTVSFSVDGGAPFASTCSVSGTTRTCTASYASSSRSGGQHSIVVTEQADTNYAAASGSGTLTVTAVADGSVNMTATGSVFSYNGGYLVKVTLTNSGTGAAPNVTLTGVTLGNAAGTPVPQSAGKIQPGASAQLTVTVPASAGASGSTVLEHIMGTYTGGSFNGTYRAVLP